MSGAALLAQEERLALLLREIKWAEEKTALYRTAFARAGVSHASVTCFSDMTRLPFLEYSEEEGADAPFFMLTLPLSGILRLSVLRIRTNAAGGFTVIRREMSHGRCGRRQICSPRVG